MRNVIRIVLPFAIASLALCACTPKEASPADAERTALEAEKVKLTVVKENLAQFKKQSAGLNAAAAELKKLDACTLDAATAALKKAGFTAEQKEGHITVTGAAAQITALQGKWPPECILLHVADAHFDDAGFTLRVFYTALKGQPEAAPDEPKIAESPANAALRAELLALEKALGEKGVNIEATEAKARDVRAKTLVRVTDASLIENSLDFLTAFAVSSKLAKLDVKRNEQTLVIDGHGAKGEIPKPPADKLFQGFEAQVTDCGANQTSTDEPNPCPNGADARYVLAANPKK